MYTSIYFNTVVVVFFNRDVVPFLEAIQKQSAFYQDLGLDMLKDGISVPGLTLKYLFKDLPHDVYFTLYDKHNRDLYDLVKSNIVGGASIIFHRYQEKGETKLREMQYGDQAKMCAGITGFDCNALYLSCLMNDIPTGWFVRRQVEDDFKPHKSHP